jgi:hypothetical protein
VGDKLGAGHHTSSLIVGIDKQEKWLYADVMTRLNRSRLEPFIVLISPQEIGLIHQPLSGTAGLAKCLH